jgi:hypothetical protein
MIFLDGVEPHVAFNSFMDNEVRLSWDVRMESIKCIEKAEDSDWLYENEYVQYFTVAKSNLPFTSQRDVVVRH